MTAKQATFVAPLSVAARRGAASLRVASSARTAWRPRVARGRDAVRDEAGPARQRGGASRDAVRAAAVPLEVTEGTFGSEVLESGVPVLVDFYAPWCGPCKLMSPLMDWAASTYAGELKVVKIDTDKFPAFVKDYTLHGLPTFAVFTDGEADGLTEGVMGKSQLKKYLEKHVPGAAEAATK